MRTVRGHYDLDMSEPSANETVANRIRRTRGELAPGEIKVVEALMDAYPTSGLVSVSQLAARSGVSTPTVLRMVQKLGFGGYPAFQDALRHEVQARLFSPVTVYPTGASGGPLEASAA